MTAEMPASPFSLEGRTVIVTGASRGLGADLARAFARAGSRVVITGRDRSRLQGTLEAITAAGGTALAVEADVTRPDHAQATIDATWASFGGLDVLVNNAGSAWGAPSLDMPLDRWNAVFAVNCTGTFLMAQAAARAMVPVGGGTIINMASVAGLASISPEITEAAGYASSKGAVITLTRELAVQWARYGIRVNAVAPGFFDTRLSAGTLSTARDSIEPLTALGRIGQPDELNGPVLFLASEAARYITGHILTVDGGMTAR